MAVMAGVPTIFIEPGITPYCSPRQNEILFEDATAYALPTRRAIVRFSRFRRRLSITTINNTGHYYFIIVHCTRVIVINASVGGTRVRRSPTKVSKIVFPIIHRRRRITEPSRN